MGINEKGANFEEDLEIDEEKDTVIFRVPAHNNVVSASFLNDFKLVSWRGSEKKHLYLIIIKFYFISKGSALVVINAEFREKREGNQLKIGRS